MWTHNRLAIALVLSFGVLLIAARADGPANPAGQVDLSQYAKLTDLSSMQTTVMSAMPQPATSAPPSDSTAAAIGSQTSRYMLADSIRPARYRSSSCTLSAGTCNLTWSTPFSSTPNPIGEPSVVNANISTNMIQCNWTAISATGATISCKAPVLTLTISLGSLTLLPNASNGLVVSGTAVQPL